MKHILFLLYLLSIAFQAKAITKNYDNNVKVTGSMYNRIEAKNTSAHVDSLMHKFFADISFMGLIEDSTFWNVVLSSQAEGSPPSSRFYRTLAGSKLNMVLHLASITRKKENYSLSIGRIKNNYKKIGSVALVYDSDIVFDGIGGHFLFFKNENITSGINSIFSSFSTDSSNQNKNSSIGFLQPYINIDLDNFSLNIATAYHDFSVQKTKLVNEKHYNGNSFDENGYLYNYKLISGDISLEYNWQNFPIAVFFNYTQNLELKKENSVYQLGMTLGKLKEVSDISLSYVHRRMEKDSLFAFYTDTAWGVNSEAERLTLKYKWTLTSSIGLDWITYKEYINDETVNQTGNIYRFNYKVNF